MKKLLLLALIIASALLKIKARGSVVSRSTIVHVVSNAKLDFKLTVEW